MLSNHPNPLSGGFPGGLPVPPTQGGTGITSYAVGDMLYANTTSSLAKLAAGTSGYFLQTQGAGAAPVWVAASGAGLGDFSGPASSTDNAIVRFDGTSGKNGQNSGILIDDSNNVTGMTSVNSTVLLGTGGPQITSSINARSPRQGLLFSGEAGASVANVPVIGTGAVTFAAWVNPTALGSAYGLIGGASGSFSVRLLADGTFGAAKSYVSTGTPSTGAITAGKTSLLVYTRSGTTGSYYINGVLSNTVTDSTDYTTAPTSIGSVTTDEKLSGSLHVLLYNRALSASEITALFESGQVSGADINSASNTAYFSSDFSSSSGWTTDGSTTISGGKLNLAANDQAYYSGLNFPSGSKIRVTITVDSLAAGNVEVYAGNGSWTTIASGAGTASAEVTTQVPLTTLNIRAGGAAVVDNVYVYKLGALLAPDAAAVGSGQNWYDTSGNNATISWTTGVQWAVPSSGKEAGKTFTSDVSITRATSANTLLHMTNAALGTASTDGFILNAATNGGVYFNNQESGGFAFQSNGTNVAVIDGSGNLTVSGTGTHSFAGKAQFASNGSYPFTIGASGITTGIQTDGNVAVRLSNSGLSAFYVQKYNDTGNLIVASANGVSILGTTTNDNAATGYVGEYVSSTVASGSAVSLTTGTGSPVTSISLTAGDWDVSGLVAFVLGGTTTLRYAYGQASTISTTTTGGERAGAVYPSGTTLLDGVEFAIPVRRVSISGTTTIYLVAQADFSVSTAAAYGMIQARRIR